MCVVSERGQSDHNRKAFQFQFKLNLLSIRLQIIHLKNMTLHALLFKFFIINNPPAREASREVANLTERKNPHTP